MIKQLLEAGVHFGHQKGRWNPKMRPFIFGERKGIYIIDLRRTAVCLQKACDFLENLVSQGEHILFVGTKRQAQPIIEEAAKRSGMFYVNTRWLGGTLTNFETIRKRVNRLKEIQRMKEDGTVKLLKKKEVVQLDKELAKLQRNLGGIAEMDRLPSAVFVVDCMREDIAVREANKLGISVIAMLDTNADPDPIDYPIPANDDAIRSIRLVLEKLVEAVERGLQARHAVRRVVATSEAVGTDAGESAESESELALAGAKIKAARAQKETPENS
ncbi:MAG: 30S ribosomal protein S2 [Candidatus Omnitrophica bacterium]|nr:30S ribosomal protein S2 [Candidatus Omnitrophota bacterium]